MFACFYFTLCLGHLFSHNYFRNDHGMTMTRTRLARSRSTSPTCLTRRRWTTTRPPAWRGRARNKNKEWKSKFRRLSCLVSCLHILGDMDDNPKAGTFWQIQEKSFEWSRKGEKLRYFFFRQIPLKNRYSKRLFRQHSWPSLSSFNQSTQYVVQFCWYHIWMCKGVLLCKNTNKEQLVLLQQTDWPKYLS